MNNKNYRKHPLIPREYIDIGMSDEEKEEQRRSFAFGNTAIENPEITKGLVKRAADELLPEDMIRWDKQ